MNTKTKILILILIFAFALFISITISYSPVDIQLEFFIILFSIAVILTAVDAKNGFKNEYIKLFLIFTAATFSLRYFYWRTFYTLNFDTFWDALGSVAVYLAEIYAFVIFFLGAFVSLRLFNREKINIDNIPVKSLPSVDIFIPTYNEPLEVLKPTVLMASMMDYPKEKFNVYILDDGGTEEKVNNPDPKISEEAKKRRKMLQNLAKEAGENVHYLTREKNVKAKAGNINEALKKTNGDLIVVFDSDHTPTQEFLRETVGFFIKNPKLFLVQTPHKFYNPDPVEKNLRIFRKVPNESEMFYSYIQKGLDFWESSFFCGSAAVLRRKYLEEVGGIAGDTITEDAETALELHSKGYESAYYSKGMVFGLQPETFSSFITQRSRWAQGMIQIFLLKTPFLKKGLKWYQRLGYLNSNIYWFFPIARIIFILAPLVFVFFKLQIYNATFLGVVAYAMPHFIFFLLLNYYLYSKYRWPFFSELYEGAISVFLIPAILSVIKNPKAPQFKVTPKGENIEKNFVSPFYKPIFILFNLTLIAFIITVIQFIINPQIRGTLTVIAFWEVLNLILLGVGVIIAYEKAEKRTYHRVPAYEDAVVFINEKAYYGKVRDISLTGIWIEVKNDISAILKDYVWDKKLKVMLKDEYNQVFSIEGKVVNANSHNIRMKFVFKGIDEEKKITQIVYGKSGKWKLFIDEEPVTPFKSLMFLIKLLITEFPIAYTQQLKQFITDLFKLKIKKIRTENGTV